MPNLNPLPRSSRPGGFIFILLLLVTQWIASASAQTALVNGGDNAGTIGTDAAGLTNVWTLTANAGDKIVLRLGTTNFTANLNLYGPDGTLVGTGAGGDASIASAVTNSGTFNVLVSSLFPGGAGGYLLHLAQIPESFVVPPGHAGGPLGNGGEYDGTLALAGLDRWTFTAQAGDSVELRVGMTNFVGNLNVYGPDGTLVSTGAGGDIPSIFTATNSGTFTVLVSSLGQGGVGAYVLRRVQFGTPFGVPATTLNNGGDNNAMLPLAGLDRWSFTANAGDNVVVRLGTTNFTGSLAVYGPDGVLLNAGAGADVPSSFTATKSGVFTALVSSLNFGGTGPYVLRLAQFGAPFTAPAATLTNGGDNLGTLALAGLDRWTFTAHAGDNVVLRLGTTNFIGNLGVYGPDGTLLTSGSGSDVPGFFTATNSGTFTALVTSLSFNGTGAYILRLALFGEPFVVPGFTLNNGGDNHATLVPAGLDRWTFPAHAGDNVVLRLGTTNFVGNLRVYGPDGTLLTSGGGTDVPFWFVATNSGTFTALVASLSFNGAGEYVLRLADFGQPFVVPAISLGNGAANDGTLPFAGLDRWTVTANAGENIVLRLGTTNFVGSLGIYGPDGTLVASAAGFDDPCAFTATNSGVFTALVTSLSFNDQGAYVLRLAHFPGLLVNPAGGAGGGFTGSASYGGTIGLAGQDLWTFAACQGDLIDLALTPTNFIGAFTLYGPDGASLGFSAGTGLSTINVTATNCGTFTLLVSSLGTGGTGTYGLTANGLSDGIKICAPAIADSGLSVNGTAGLTNAGATFVLSSAPNPRTPAALWTPIYTNQFDRIGVFNFTNEFDPGLLQQYFRFSIRP